MSASDILSTQTKRLSLLIVEDDPLLLGLLEDMLESEPFEKTFVDSTEAALDHIEQGRQFDILITDYLLPGTLKGTELAQQASARLQNLKVIVVTGYDPGELEKADPSYTILQKPYTAKQLLESIAKLA